MLRPLVLWLLFWGPGTRGALVKLLQDAGAQVIVTAVPNQLREADGMVVTGGASSLEAYEDLKAKDAERVIGRRVAGGRPVLVAGAALTCLFDSGYGEASADGADSGAVHGEWPGGVWTFYPRPGAGVSAPAFCLDSALLKDLEGEAHFKSEHGVLSGLLIRALNILPLRGDLDCHRTCLYRGS